MFGDFGDWNGPVWSLKGALGWESEADSSLMDSSVATRERCCLTIASRLLEDRS